METVGYKEMQYEPVTRERSYVDEKRIYFIALLGYESHPCNMTSDSVFEIRVDGFVSLHEYSIIILCVHCKDIFTVDFRLGIFC